jgi:N-acetylmuramoyl-L-alanine amidase
MTFRDQDLTVLAKTLYGEARGEGQAGLEAVAHVILNRSKRRGKSIADICLAPKQFSCWNESDPNKKKLEALRIETDPESPAYLRCIATAAGVLAGDIVDRSGGADHYHASDISPSWARDMDLTGIIGHHKFYRS